MTTRPAPKLPPRLDLTAREWRLVLLSVVAAAYVAVWALLSARTPERAQSDEPSARGESTRVAWLDELSPAEQARLQLDLPRGLEVASRGAAASRPDVPAVRRVPGPARFRTRSS